MRMISWVPRASRLTIPAALLLLQSLAGIDCSESKNPAGTEPDVVAPTVSLAVSETLVLDAAPLLLTATASDDVGVTAVSFYDGDTLLQTMDEAPYELSIGLAEGDNGVHHYRAEAEDAAGNSAASAVHDVIVAINHQPVLLIGGFDTDADGWELHHFDPWSGWSDASGNPPGCMVLNEFGSCDVDPGVTQTVDGLIPGLSYELTGEYRPYVEWIGNPAAASFVVTVDSVVVAAFARGPNGLDWSPFTASFTATATAHSIGFWAEHDCDDSSYDLDSVQIAVGR